MELLKQTIGRILEKNASQDPEGIAVIYNNLNLQYSWKDLNHIVNKIVNGLVNLGVKQGDHVAIWATNVPEWYQLQLATARMGCRLITVNPEWKKEEIRYALRQSDTNVLVMLRGFVKQGKSRSREYNYLEIIRDIVPELKSSGSDEALKLESFPELRRIVLISDTKEQGMILWSELLDNPGEEYPSVDDPEEVVMIQYTSGTTGFPKGAMLTHYNVVNNARIASSHLKLRQDDILCGPVPYYHCFGSILVNLLGLVSGTTIVIPGQYFNSVNTLKAVEKYKCTVLHGVPTMFIDELEEMERNEYDLNGVRTGIIAGAPVDQALMENIQQKMGAMDMTIGYGLTEASPITHQTDVEDPVERKVNSVGRPIMHTESKVVDPKTFKDLKNEEVGEIWVRGFNIMKGYYKKPDDTAHAITSEGWLRSGDLGLVDEEGYYRVVGRLKEMLIVGGHNVYPAEVEQTLHNLLKDRVEFIQVVGVPDKRLQEVVGVAVKCIPGQTIELDELKRLAENHMEWSKVPRYMIRLEDFSNVMTVTGKIQKFKLQELFIERIKRRRITRRSDKLIEL